MVQVSDQPAAPGILMPVLQRCWRIVFNSRRTEDSDMLSMQAIRCNINYKTKTLHLELEQSASGDLQETIYDLMGDKSIRFRIDAMDGNDRIFHSIEFNRAEVINHNIVFDYAISDTVKHYLEFSFEQMTVLYPTYDKEK